MSQAVTCEILDLLAEMKKRALCPPERIKIDSLAIGIITQDIRPHVMAENLQHWLDLAKVI